MPSAVEGKRNRAPSGSPLEIQMLERKGGRFPAAGGTHEESFLNQVGLIDFFDRPGFFANRDRERVESDWSSVVFLDDASEDPLIHLVETVAVYLQCQEGEFGDFL